VADPCATYTFGGLTINGAETTDTLITPSYDNIVGLDGAPIRRQVDPEAQTDVIVFSGLIHIGTYTGDDVPTFLAKVVALQKAVVSACEAQLTSAASLAWTDSTGDARAISCKYGLPGQEVQFGGQTPLSPTFANLTLWAPDPTIT
jgi:hypothetical protein